MPRSLARSARQGDDRLSTLATSWTAAALAADESASSQDRLDEGLSELGLHPRLIGVLERAGVLTVGDLFRRKWEDLLSLPSVGRVYAKQIAAALRRAGFDVPCSEEEYVAMTHGRKKKAGGGHRKPSASSVTAADAKDAHPEEKSSVRRLPLLSPAEALARCVSELQPIVQYVSSILGADDPLSQRLAWIAYYAQSREPYSSDTLAAMAEAAGVSQVVAQEEAAPGQTHQELAALQGKQGSSVEVVQEEDRDGDSEVVQDSTEDDTDYDFDDQFDEDWDEDFDEDDEEYARPELEDPFTEDDSDLRTLPDDDAEDDSE